MHTPVALIVFNRPDTTAQVLWAQVHGAAALVITLRPEHWPGAPPAADLVEQAIENAIRGFR